MEASRKETPSRNAPVVAASNAQAAGVTSLELAKQIIREEARALDRIAEGLGESFLLAVDRMENCHGSVLVCGIGKAGLVGQKVSATFCSTGTRSFFLHPSEAIHGDLGRVMDQDLLLVFSMSGETEEVTRLLPSFRAMSGGLIAVTADRHSTLGRGSDVVIELGKLPEADSNGLAPSSSTTAMLAVGDALALTLSHRRGFCSDDFVQYHPGGSLGRKLTLVTEKMRPLKDCRVVQQNQSVREALMTLGGSGRRTGAVMIVDEQECLVGIFTDSDLARLLERDPAEDDQGNALLQSVGEVMTADPITIEAAAKMPAALSLLAHHQISELPVVEANGKPVGLVDITDLVSWLPNPTANPTASPTTSPATHDVPAENSHATTTEPPRLLKFPRIDEDTTRGETR